MTNTSTTIPSPAAATALRPLVEIDELEVSFVTREATARAVNGLSLSIMPGEVLCLIGESGSGKSVTMRALMRLLPKGKTRFRGRIRVGDRDILTLKERELKAVRGAEIAMVFQEPMTSLDPVYTVGDQIAETVMRHEGCTRAQAIERALELLKLVRVPLPEQRLRAYPHELSGGLRQRIMIATALSCRPQLLLADEPTTALDATVQIQVLILLRKLQAEFGMSVIFVTHDLGVAAQIADKVAVMYAGQIVEYGATRDVLLRPNHPYTLGLLASTVHGQKRDKDIEAIGGSPPDLRALPAGCSFAPRCRYARAACTMSAPPAATFDGVTTRCFRTQEIRENKDAARTAIVN